MNTNTIVLRTLLPVLLFFSTLTPCSAFAQIETGIKFIQVENWKKALELAKRENKIIFIDAFTTWCGPCKKMDADIYTDKNIGDYVNKNFIALKVQCDKTSDDSEIVKNWYADAKYLMNYYHISAFPTLLFVSPEGKIVDIAIGYHNQDDFLKLVKTANSQDNSYAGMIKKFQDGTIQDKMLLNLALKAQKNGQDSLALEIAKVFKKKQIDNTNPSNLFSPIILEFFTSFYRLLSVNDSSVIYMFENPKSADSLFNMNGVSKKITDFLITRDVINPIIRPNGRYSDSSPDWAAIQDNLAELYNSSTAISLTRKAKIKWYSDHKDWDKVVKYTIEKMDTEGLDTAGLGGSAINNFVFYTVFKHSQDRSVLKKAKGYMEVLLQNNPTNYFWLDTYAGVLYKMGRKEDALREEKKAISLAMKMSDENTVKAYRETLRKMSNNEPTWE